jgi:hypothetical protein
VLTEKPEYKTMNDAQLLAAAKSAPKGANVYVVWERQARLRAAYKGFPLFKRTKMLLRLGVDYDHMDEVIEGRKNGNLPAENAGMPGKEWVEFPIVKRSMKTGKLLLSVKLAQVFGRKVTAAETTWFVREAGIETVVKKADHADKMLADEFKKSEIPRTFDLTGENVLSINGVSRLEEEIEANREEEIEA